jgi:hypothetical protein
MEKIPPGKRDFDPTKVKFAHKVGWIVTASEVKYRECTAAGFGELWDWKVS